jgi:DNA-binding protein HU-beta
MTRVESLLNRQEEIVNKAELIEALSDRLGDRKTATAALDAVLAEVQAAVTKGDRVAITGFGVFEKRVRGPRTARNPRTGETVKVKKTSVPTFRPGAGFKDMVASGKAPKAAKKTVTAKATRKAAAKKTTEAKAAPAAKKAARKTAKAAPAKTTAAKKTTAKTTARGAAAKKAPAKKAPAKKTAARKATGRR